MSRLPAAPWLTDPGLTVPGCFVKLIHAGIVWIIRLNAQQPATGVKDQAVPDVLTFPDIRSVRGVKTPEAWR